MPPLRNSSSGYLNGSDKILRDMEDRFYFVSPSSSQTQSFTSDQQDDDETGDYRDEEEIANNILEPPDGGWGWVIVAASFLCNLIVDGIAYTFGIFFMEFVRFYNVPKGKVAWVGSLLCGFYLIVGIYSVPISTSFGDTAYIGSATRGINRRMKEHRKDVTEGNPTTPLIQLTQEDTSATTRWSEVLRISPMISRSTLLLQESRDITLRSDSCNSEKLLKISYIWKSLMNSNCNHIQDRHHNRDTTGI